MRRSIVVLAGLVACGSPSGGGGKGAAGSATGAAVVAAVEKAAETIEPWRCARFDDPVVVTAPAGWTLAGKRLERAAGGATAGPARGTKPPGPTTIAVVAEARGASEVTAKALAALRTALDAAPVDVVVTLGGMGADADEIGRALAPIAEHAPWLVIAVPGDREPLVAHRAAVAALAAAGAPIVDGSQVRVIDAGGAILGTLPGAPVPERLGAGSGGCVHGDSEIADLLREVALVGDAAAKAKRAVPTVLLGQRAPRGDSDLAFGGVHAGDVAYARVLAGAPVDLVVHAAVDDAPPRPGQARRGRRAGPRSGTGTGTATATATGVVPAAVGVGAIDATPRYRPDGARIPPTALVLTATGATIAWKTLLPKVVL